MSLVIVDVDRRIIATDTRLTKGAVIQDGNVKAREVAWGTLAYVGTRRVMDCVASVLEENPEMALRDITPTLSKEFHDLSDEGEWEIVYGRNGSAYLLEPTWCVHDLVGITAYGAGSDIAAGLLRVMPLEEVFAHVNAICPFVSASYLTYEF